jgi:hypothetical protein
MGVMLIPTLATLVSHLPASFLVRKKEEEDAKQVLVIGFSHCQKIV